MQTKLCVALVVVFCAAQAQGSFIMKPLAEARLNFLSNIEDIVAKGWDRHTDSVQRLYGRWIPQLAVEPAARTTPTVEECKAQLIAALKDRTSQTVEGVTGAINMLETHTRLADQGSVANIQTVIEAFHRENFGPSVAEGLEAGDIERVRELVVKARDFIEELFKVGTIAANTLDATNPELAKMVRDDLAEIVRRMTAGKVEGDKILQRFQVCLATAQKA